MRSSVLFFTIDLLNDLVGVFPSQSYELYICETILVSIAAYSNHSTPPSPVLRVSVTWWCVLECNALGGKLCADRWFKLTQHPL